MEDPTEITTSRVGMSDCCRWCGFLGKSVREQGTGVQDGLIASLLVAAAPIIRRLLQPASKKQRQGYCKFTTRAVGVAIAVPKRHGVWHDGRPVGRTPRLCAC
ncbi:hypothetical protein LIA77_10978 [Sarocladium implicatum]|nr:hypothetical protein LIA77_10978 [Sarocladium implicatum]